LAFVQPSLYSARHPQGLSPERDPELKVDAHHVYLNVAEAVGYDLYKAYSKDRGSPKPAMTLFFILNEKRLYGASARSRPRI